MDDRPVLRVEGLTKRFGDRTAFEDVSLSIGPGEVFGLLGPNGAGKTTFVRTCATLLRPTGGSGEIVGHALLPENATSIRARIAVMPETPGLYGSLSVEENLRFFARLQLLDGIDGRIGRALAAVGLEGRRFDACRSLSKGLRQRVALARTLLGDPELIFLDEPTSGLDPVAAKEVHELIGSLRGQGRAVLITTHRLEEAERLCDRVAILLQRVRAVGSPGSLGVGRARGALLVRIADDAHDAVPVLAASGMHDGLEIIDAHTVRITTEDPADLAPRVAAAVVGAGLRLVELTSPKERLEDVYLSLVNEDTEAVAP